VGNAELARTIVRHARQQFASNVDSLTLDEALFAADGFRSILGVLKHLGGWVHVYWSNAFETVPKDFRETSWPHGRRDTVETTEQYLHDVVAWVDHGLDRWERTLATVSDADLERGHGLHWGGTAPLREIVVMVAHHVAYHTGELNMLLSIARGEAWEYTEEVEENHISTIGHRVRPAWMSDEQAREFEATIAH
jgi:uncharacterized damage-inducible protein DinB